MGLVRCLGLAAIASPSIVVHEGFQHAGVVRVHHRGALVQIVELTEVFVVGALLLVEPAPRLPAVPSWSWRG